MSGWLKGTAHRRRSWRKLHIGIDAGSGEIVAIELTTKDIDDAERTGTLLDQVEIPSRRSPPTEPMIRTEYTRPSPSVIRMRP